MLQRYLAIDLGAESGRGMLATLTDGRVSLEEVHRFPNQPVEILDTLFWDIPRLFHEVKASIARAAQRLRPGEKLSGISVDTWGVDYGLLDTGGQLLGNPVHYRDSRTDTIMNRVFERIPRQRIFEETGLLFIRHNTIFQLAAELERDPSRLQRASRLLFIPDLFHYFLTGTMCTEETVASTSQMWHGGRKSWSLSLLEDLGMPTTILPEVHPPGTVVGPLRDDIARAAGLAELPPVIAGASHDTGAAVAAIPAVDPPSADGETWGFISSGTWSLMGVELRRPLITNAVLAAQFSNEVGVDSTFRFLKIIMGLWLIQESRRTWELEGESLDYATLATLAGQAPPLQSLIDPDDPVFFRPGDMPRRIRALCRENGEPIPDDRAAVTRCALECLALTYADCAAKVGELTGKRIGRLHVVGGGSQNRLLNQFTANALRVEVVAGPAEATALGNALVQAIATGALGSLEELRGVVRRSTGLETFTPQEDTAGAWREAADRFTLLKERGRERDR